MRLTKAHKQTLRVLETTRLVLHTNLCQEYESCVDACRDALTHRRDTIAQDKIASPKEATA